MHANYEILVPGNNLALKDGFLGLSSIVWVTTPDGPLLFDTGHHTTKAMLLKGLKARGYEPGDVPTVVLSHLHFDHANNLELFPNAKVYVSRREYEYAADPHPDDLYVPGHIRAQLDRMDVSFLEQEGEIAPGVRWIAAPGHTPGLISLVLEGTPQGCVVLASDAIKYAKEVTDRRCDLAFDTREAGTATIGRILKIADRIVPGHFPEMIRTENGWTWDSAEVPLLVR